VFGLLKALFLVLRIPIYLAQIKLKLLLWHNDLYTSKAARIIYIPPRKFDEVNTETELQALDCGG
jgi:hypothetical protein